MNKKLLCVDFDGVIHSYTSGWKGATIIPDPPVPGAIEWLYQACKVFRVCIYSSRSNQEGGIEAMQNWLRECIGEFDNTFIAYGEWENEIEWPTSKPPAFLTIDDRAITFTGEFTNVEELAKFQPWYK